MSEENSLEKKENSWNMPKEAGCVRLFSLQKTSSVLWLNMRSMNKCSNRRKNEKTK